MPSRAVVSLAITALAAVLADPWVRSRAIGVLAGATIPAGATVPGSPVTPGRPRWLSVRLSPGVGRPRSMNTVTSAARQLAAVHANDVPVGPSEWVSASPRPSVPREEID